MPDIKGFEALIKKLGLLPKQVEHAAEIAVKQVTEKAADDARHLAPSNKFKQTYSNGTAPIRGSITEEFENTGHECIGHVICNAPHAAYVEFGTGPIGAANHAGTSPHVNVSYTPRESWVYPYETAEGTQFATTSGQPARPFLYPAAKLNENLFKTAMEYNLKKAVKE